MKNYYDQQTELNILLLRIAALKDKKQLYFNRTQPTSPKFGEKVESSHKKSEPFLEYTAKIEELDKELEELYKEKEILEKYLKQMEKNLRSMKGLLEKLFVARYIDGLDVRRIAIKYNYSEPHIYRLLGEVNRIIKKD